MSCILPSAHSLLHYQYPVIFNLFVKCSLHFLTQVSNFTVHHSHLENRERERQRCPNLTPDIQIQLVWGRPQHLYFVKLFRYFHEATGVEENNFQFYSPMRVPFSQTILMDAAHSSPCQVLRRGGMGKGGVSPFQRQAVDLDQYFCTCLQKPLL